MSFSDVELAAVRAAAAKAGLAPRAWIGEASVGAAQVGAGSGGAGRLPSRELVVALAELTEARRVLRNVGGNLNDVARHANSTGEVAEETVAVERLVARVVGAVDDAVARLDAVVRQGGAGRTGRRAGRPRSGPVATSGPAGGHAGQGGVLGGAG